MDVTVTTAGGTSATSSADLFESAPSQPIASSISPAMGSSNGGTTVTITGNNLFGATAVNFGTVAAASYTAVSAHADHGRVADAVRGILDITVTTAGGTSPTTLPINSSSWPTSQP